MKLVSRTDARREQWSALAQNSRGFTLLEVMVVIVIIGIMASLVGINVIKRLEESRIEATQIQLATFRDALDMFKIDNGTYPDSGIGLEAVAAGGYLRDNRMPPDPWNHPYLYVSEDGWTYTVWSTGPDGRPGTDDDVFAK
ncbi:MAG: type II secretion system major pseudopilin GspG [Candidatus Lernaella stagnicola]|nr:type II secretion system major pseudopilin GspG [Candidatus Lernaella stagnicola]